MRLPTIQARRLLITTYVLQVRRVRHETHLCHRETHLDEVPELLRQLSHAAGRLHELRRKNFSRLFEAPKVDRKSGPLCSSLHCYGR